MNIISIREHPEHAEQAIAYFQSKWATEQSKPVYEDCINSCIRAQRMLPQWYLLLDGTKIVGCAGLITNDFISRMDLYPWMCALYVEPEHRGQGLARLLIDRVKQAAKTIGYSKLYLCTDLEGFYERYDFTYLAQGYHPWGEESRIYEIEL